MQLGASLIVFFVVLIAAAAVVIALLARFYRKSTPDVALVRTGAGGRRIVINGGCLALPFLHQVQRANLKAVPVEISLSGNRAVITADRLRADIDMEFLTRIDASEDGLARAAQALGARVARPEDLAPFIESHIVAAIRAAAATRPLDALHKTQSEFAEMVAGHLAPTLARLGLILEASSLKRVDQAPFAQMDERNAFDAAGMRHLSALVSEHRMARIRIEAEADMEVRRSQLALTRDRLETERAETEIEAQVRLAREKLAAQTDAEIAKYRTHAENEATRARLAAELATKTGEIERDQDLRRKEMEAILELETRKADQTVALTAKRAEEVLSQATLDKARADAANAAEAVQTAREVAAAERGRKIAVLKTQQESETEAGRTRAKAENLTVLAAAESEADRIRAEAESRRAMIMAENDASPALMAMKLEMHRLDRLPEIATQMMKPVEKIESIRINHIGGLGATSGSADGGSPLNQAMESILGMAVQLPMMKKIGDEIGLDFDVGMAGRTADAASRLRMPAKPASTADKT